MKKKRIYHNYKNEIFELIKDCYIKTPNNFCFSSESAYTFLNSSINKIDCNYGKIVFILNTIFNVNDSELIKWSNGFYEYVSLNKELIAKMNDYVGYSPVAIQLTDVSKRVFCNYINDINAQLNEFSFICSSLLGKIKRNPEDKAVFIVHGHDFKLKTYLNKALKRIKYNPILLSDMNDSGITLFDKFEKYANKCMKAIILMTKDDFVQKDDLEYYQARPNVLIEFGYFLNMLDRKDIVVLAEKGCKIATDIDGVAYIEYDNNPSEVVCKILDSLNIS